MSKTPINPITLRGKHNGGPSNLSIGRLWLGSNKLSDGSHRFDPKNPQPQWNKPIIFALWSQDASDAKSACCTEDDFISMVKRLSAQEINAVVIWGRETIVGVFDEKDSNNRGLLFDRTVDSLVITMYDGNKVALGSTTLSFATFLDGLSHLFPKGELNV